MKCNRISKSSSKYLRCNPKVNKKWNIVGSYAFLDSLKKDKITQSYSKFHNQED